MLNITLIELYLLGSLISFLLFKFTYNPITTKRILKREPTIIDLIALIIIVVVVSWVGVGLTIKDMIVNNKQNL